MTFQISDILIIENDTYPLWSTPLLSHPSIRNIDWDKLDSYLLLPTSNIRGYIGSWWITNNRLYLFKLEPYNHEMGKILKNILIELHREKYIYADWFTGNLLVPIILPGERRRWLGVPHHRHDRIYQIVEGKLKGEIEIFYDRKIGSA